MFQKITRKHLKKFIQKYCNDAYTLDLGCANSPYSQYFKNRVGFDIAPGQGVEVVGDAHALPFADGTFEQVVCTEVLEHLHTPKLAVSEISRILKPTGIVILTTRFVYPLHDVPHDYFRYTKYGLRNLFSDWEIIELMPETATFSAIGALMQRIGFQTRLRGGKFTKLFVYFFAWIIQYADALIVSEYGDIQKKTTDDHIMTTGYYLVARKRK